MSEIQKIEFSVFGSEDVRRHSVLHVTSHDLFEKNIPKAGGLCDLRLGTIDREYKCQTCYQTAIHCPGHFGHIELCEPVYNILYVKYLTKIIQSVCMRCSAVLIKDTSVNMKSNRKENFKKTTDQCKTKQKCQHCDYVQKKIIFENFKFMIQNNEEEFGQLSMVHVQTVLKNIPEESLHLLGFNKRTKPCEFIITAFPVPPPQVRPSIIIDSSIKSQDDLTFKLIEIIKTNNALIKAKQSEANESIISEFSSLLQYHVSTFIDNGISGIPQSTQRTGRPIKGVSQRLKAKEGRIRGNLMGKRVDFSGRTVITAEPNIDLNELGVPHKMAQILTYQETVNKFNILKLQDYVDNGPNAPFGKTGAKYIYSKDGKQKDLRFVNPEKPAILEIGDKVDRQLKDGDLVVFNRQPSLHKFSMMGHKVRVMPYSTFRMNLSATKPYNADFDGDEMNIHVPQSEQTRAEVQELMMIENNIVSGQSNKPVIGVIQDALLGTFKITSRDTFICMEEFMNIMMKLKKNDYKLPPPAIYKPTMMWTGKQVFDLILPNINLHRFTPQHNETDHRYFSVNDTEVLIKKGRLLSGQLCKRTVGESEGGIVHITWLDYGPKRTNDFISQTQFLVNCWLQNTGFSVGAGDIFANKTSNMSVRSIIDSAKEKVNQIITIGKRNSLDQSIYEGKINQALNNAVSQSGREVEKNTTLKNNIRTTVTSGSKGSILNLAQIMGCVGQQNVSGKRVALGYTDRVLPHFERNDITPAARGFVENSYMKGLEPHEFFYHAMGGREGVIDTACKTSESGYIQRRLVKAMEDLQISADKSIRNSIGDIVQFVYGMDGMNPVYLISENIQYWKTETEFKDRFVERSTPKKEIEALRKIDRNQFDVFKSPVHIHRLLETIHMNHPSKYEKLSAKFIYEKIEDMLLKLSIYVNSKNATYSYFSTKVSRTLHDLLRITCSSKQIRKEHKFTKIAFLELIDKIVYEFNRSIIDNGEMVGTASAQSLGERITQLTLNTFHLAGIGTKNVTLGVPRLKEIINVSKNIKCPSMILPLKSEYNTKDSAEKIAAEMEYTKLHSLIKSFRVVQDNTSEHSSMYFGIPDESSSDYSLCDTVIKYTIDVEALRQKKLNILDLSITLMQQYPDQIKICHNNENCDEVVLDIHIIKQDGFENINVNRYIRVMSHRIQHECIIQGNIEIKKTYISEDNDQFYIETDGTNIDQLMNNPYFDYTNIKTNDIMDVYETLGIEAARALLLDELRKVIEFDGTYVNLRHFLTLVDTMTYKGDIMAITRHGINKTNTGPLMKCSFEETVDVLTDAAVFSETDSLNGVTENIIVGKMSGIGTGNVDMYMDI